jgi:predicted anti-sigma-YlaC factor YlaD
MADSLREKLRDGVLNFFASNCKDTTQIVSESMDHRISILKQCKIKFHLELCEFCRHYREQLEAIRDLARGLKKEGSEVDPESQLKSSSRERMKNLLKENDK